MVAAVRASAYIGGTKEQAPKRRGWQGGPGMTGEAPVPEAREISLSSGSIRSLGHAGICFGKGLATGKSVAASAAAEVGMKGA
jgi:hypothetical protein